MSHVLLSADREQPGYFFITIRISKVTLSAITLIQDQPCFLKDVINAVMECLFHYSRRVGGLTKFILLWTNVLNNVLHSNMFLPFPIDYTKVFF